MGSLARSAVAASAMLALAVAAGPARAADDYPVCSGDTSAAGVAQKDGPLLRFGVTPRVQAGQVGPVPAPAQPEDPAKTLAALARLQSPDAPFVVRLNRFFWSDGEAAFTQFLAETRRYAAAGYLVELQVRYHPSAAQEGDIPAWTRWVREVVDRFGSEPGVIGLQITNEVNFGFSQDSSDGSFKGAKDALIQGVIAAKDEARRAGFGQLTIGFNWAYRSDPGNERSFWDYLRAHGGKAFTDSLDWVGLDAYPGTFFPPAEQTADDYRDGMVNGMSSFRCYLRAAGILDTVPMHVEENGWPTYGTRSEDMQAVVAQRMISAVSDFRGTYNVTDYRWFNLRDGDTSDPTLGQHYGLMRSDYTEKPAFAVVAGLFRQLTRRGGSMTGGGTPDCLKRVGNARRSGIGRIRLGMRRSAVLHRLGPATGQGPASMRYCVDGGGDLMLAFDALGRLRFVASSSSYTRVRGIRPGSPLLEVKRRYAHALSIGNHMVRATRRSRIVFGTCSCGSVVFVAVTNAGRARRVRLYAKRAGVPRGN